MGKRSVAVVLAGCGNLDGNNVIEVMALLHAIASEGASYSCFAPRMEQHEVVNHLTGQVVPERREVMAEAARLVQGNVRELGEFHAEEFDALAFPGGLGVIKNLCAYALSGMDCTVNTRVEAAIRDTHRQGKPIAALCIAPVLVARVLRDVAVTLGGDCPPARDIVAYGAQHRVCGAGEYTVDARHRVYSSPCFMLPNDIVTVFSAVGAMVRDMLRVAGAC